MSNTLGMLHVLIELYLGKNNNTTVRWKATTYIFESYVVCTVYVLENSYESFFFGIACHVHCPGGALL